MADYHGVDDRHMVRASTRNKQGIGLQASLGRFIDRIHIGTLGLLYLLLLLGSAVVLWFLTPYGHGVRGAETFWDLVYFSIVTVTSLGFGDLVPTGFGRVVAAVGVLCGLGLLSLMVAKVASERQAQLTRLLYSSDHERRINDLTSDVSQHRRALTEYWISLDAAKLNTVLRPSSDLFEGMFSYVTFQRRVGLFGPGHITSLRRCIREICEFTEDLVAVSRQSALPPDTTRLLEGAAKSALKTMSVLGRIENDPVLERRHRRGEELVHAVSRNLARARSVHSSGKLTPELLGRVRSVLPTGEWERHMHKRVGSELGISNRLAQKALDRIIDDERDHAESGT